MLDDDVRNKQIKLKNGCKRVRLFGRIFLASGIQKIMLILWEKVVRFALNCLISGVLQLGLFTAWPPFTKTYFVLDFMRLKIEGLC